MKGVVRQGNGAVRAPPLPLTVVKVVAAFARGMGGRRHRRSCVAPRGEEGRRRRSCADAAHALPPLTVGKGRRRHRSRATAARSSPGEDRESEGKI